LGHGITPDVDPDRVAVLVDTVREYEVPGATG
jgi:uroporphyrinogen-III decarboxylase